MANKSIAQKPPKVKFLFERSESRKAELRRLYDWLIERARGREFVSGLHERHHIQPRCLGGSDESNNIAILTFGEHFLAHYLLALTTEGKGRRKMLFALNKMAAASKTNKNRIITRRQFEISRKAIVEALSGPEHGRSVSAGMVRRKEELGPEAHGKAISSGHARRKEELGPEAYAAWCAELGKATSAGIVRRKEELGPEDYAARCAELGNAISAGLVRRKEELGPEDYAAWCVEVGKATSAGHARRKEELGPEEYAAWCAERGKAISAGLVRRKEELGPEEYAAWYAEVGKATSAGHARRKEELGPEEYAAWCAERGKAISAGMLKNSPPVRCLNDGKEHENAVSAANFYGLRDSSAIHRVCRGRRKTTGGLRFEYIERADAKRP